jgi:hypothetical protein
MNREALFCIMLGCRAKMMKLWACGIQRTQHAPGEAVLESGIWRREGAVHRNGLF